jgi:phytoene synthase
MIEHDAFASFEQKWLAAHPENRVIAVFLPAAQRRRAAAFGSLVHELEQAAFRVREPQVAAAKLEWWQRELHEAALGTARHPITQQLFADEFAHEVDPALWPALADGALEQLELPGAGTLAALLEQLDPFFSAVARAELALLGNARGNVDANAALWTFSHLLHDLPLLAETEGRLPVPLGLLARHEVVRADLAAPSPRRNMLVKDFLDELVLETGGALGVASVRTLQSRVRTRLDHARFEKALRVTDPLAYLRAHPHAGRWRTLMTVWREARNSGHALDS